MNHDNFPYDQNGGYLNVSVTNGKFCFSSFFLPLNITSVFFFFFLNTTEQSSVWNVCDRQMGNIEHFNPMRVFTSQGDLFVLWAKRPLRGLQLLSFCHFRCEVQPPAAAAEAPTTCSAHTQKRSSLISELGKNIY